MQWFDSNRQSDITGGEDTVVRIAHIDFESSTLTSLQCLQAHISCVAAVSSTNAYASKADSNGKSLPDLSFAASVGGSDEVIMSGRPSIYQPWFRCSSVRVVPSLTTT